MKHLPDAAQTIAEEQGWDEESIIIHLMGFIASKDLEAELETYLEEVAEEENGETDTSDDVEEDYE